MLLVLHNLPTYMNYGEIKQLIHSKCGLSQVILDNLVSEGLTKKVTVGLADSADAAIFARKINGLYIGGQQLYVEDVRIQKESEQPYRSSKAPIPYSPRDAFGGLDAPTQMVQGLPEVALANAMGNSMAMMNYNMAMGNYFMPSPMNAVVPMAPRMTGFNQAQEPAMSDIAQMYDQSRQCVSFDRSMNEDIQRSRKNREPKGRASNRHSPPLRLGPIDFDSRSRRSEFHADRDRGSNVNFDNNQMWNQQNAAIQALDAQSNRRSRWNENTEHTQSRASGQQNHSDQYSNFYKNLQAATFAPLNRQNSSFENKREDFKQPSKRVRSKWDEEPQPKRPALSGMLERPPRNSNWKESAFVETDAYPSNTSMSVPNTWNKTISKSSGFTPNTVSDNRYSSAPQNRNEPVNMEKQLMKSNTWRGQATSALSKEIANKFRVNIKTDFLMLAQLKTAIRSRINKMLKNDIHTTPERIQELFRAKHNYSSDVDIYREALNAVKLYKEKEEKPEPTLEEMTDMMTMLPPKVYPKANNNGKSSARSSAWAQKNFDIKPSANASAQKNFKKPFANAPPPKNFDKKPFANAQPTKNFDKKPFANAPPTKNFDKKPFANAPPQKNFKKPFGNAPLQKNFDKKMNNKKLFQTDQEAGLPKYPNSDKKSLAIIKDLEKKELSGEQVYELPSDLQKIVEGHCDTLCDLFMGECLNPEGEEEENVCEEINNVAADEFRKVIRLQLMKRILNITNGLVIQIYFSFKPPRKPFLEAFLQKYDVICLKKATGDKKYVASFGSFKGYDALNSLNSAVVENVNLNFRPRIATGQKAKRGAGRKAFVKVHSNFTKPPGQGDGTKDEYDNSKTNYVDDVKEEDAGVKTEMDGNTTDVKTEGVTKVEIENEAPGDIAHQTENTQEANDNNDEQFTNDVNEGEYNVNFNEENSNFEVGPNEGGEEYNEGEEEHNDDEEEHNDGEGHNDGEEEHNNGEEEHNDGEEGHNDGEQEHNEGEEEHNDGEEELNDGEEYNDGANADATNEIENVDENDLEDW